MRFETFSLFFLLICSSNGHANIDLSRLDRSQRDDLYSGKMILLTQTIENAVWPKLEIFSFVKASPLELVSFFTNFEAQRNYIPELLHSKIINQSDPLDIHVEYEMNLPWPIPNARYTHGHRLSRVSPKHYNVSWYMIKSSVANKVEGSSDFIAFEDKTLWHYQSLVEPESALAGLFSSSMQADTLKSLEETRAAFLHAKSKNPEQIEKAVETLLQRFSNSTK